MVQGGTRSSFWIWKGDTDFFGIWKGGETVFGIWKRGHGPFLDLEKAGKTLWKGRAHTFVMSGSEPAVSPNSIPETGPGPKRQCLEEKRVREDLFPARSFVELTSKVSFFNWVTTGVARYRLSLESFRNPLIDVKDGEEVQILPHPFSVHLPSVYFLSLIFYPLPPKK